MDLINIINNRKSVRAFTNKNVDYKLIEKIIDNAKNCATGGNMQPWNIAIIAENSKKELSRKLCAAYDNKVKPNPDYNYYPEANFEPYTLRRHQSGMSVYEAIGINFNDKNSWDDIVKLGRRNYDFFGAKIGLIFYADKRLTEGANLDIGMFMQNIILLAEYFNLSSCPQASIANYPDIIREHLNLKNNMKIICAMGLGYADKKAKINNVLAKKASLEDFINWHTI